MMRMAGSILRYRGVSGSGGSVDACFSPGIVSASSVPRPSLPRLSPNGNAATKTLVYCVLHVSIKEMSCQLRPPPPPPPGDTYLHVVHCGPAARAHVARGRCPVATFRQLILVFRGITAQHCESPDPLNNAVTSLPLLLPPPHLCMGRYWSVLPLI